MVLALWIPLRQWPDIGTLCNVVVVGSMINLTIFVIPQPSELPVRALTLWRKGERAVSRSVPFSALPAKDHRLVVRWSTASYG